MIRPGGESPRATLLWSMVTIGGLCLGAGASRIPALATVWDVGGGAFERRESQDARNDGYYEELLDAGERRGGGGWFTSPAATMPAHWPRLHETEGVIWDEPFQRFRLRPGADFVYKGAALGINDLGLRDRPTTLEKAPGVRRVALVGASILMGSGVPVAETFENRVEDAVALGALGEACPRLVDRAVRAAVEDDELDVLPPPHRPVDAARLLGHDLVAYPLGELGEECLLVVLLEAELLLDLLELLGEHVPTTSRERA